jgi:D-alanyl-lipoteichoic acid acyltransferase DltB (MBOAT superfamily)
VLFPTATFAIFFVIVLPLSWLLMPTVHRWRPFIIVASFVFYGWWDWRFVLLLAGSIAWNQLMALRVHRAAGMPSRRKSLLWLAIGGNLALLGYFKYYDFFISSTQNLATLVGLDVPLEVRTVILPVGISFYTFMGISYVVDVYRGDAEPTTLEKFAVYLSFFPHLVAGPIVRPNELIPQLDTPRSPRRVDTSRAFYLIAAGLFKKVVISSYLASNIVDEVFADPSQHSSLEILIAVYAYAVQIYADFSGYTDIAIGIALLLGFNFPQNFDSPYAATSLQDFWRRWHMTLSRWLRDYVYIPLGGSRRGVAITYRNLLLTMLLGGLWHGAGWTFVAWGLIHGVGLCVERLWRERRGVKPEESFTRWDFYWRRLVTFHVVCFAWIFFRAETFEVAWQMITGLVTRWGEASPLVTGPVLLAIAVGIGSQYLPPRLIRAVLASFSRLNLVAQAAVLAVALMVTQALGPQDVAPFIYFQF